jgi:hypothetical protein
LNRGILTLNCKHHKLSFLKMKRHKQYVLIIQCFLVRGW